MKNPYRTKLHLHVGLRMCKTALAVAVSLLITELLHTPSPIFAGLGAIVVMARTLLDSLRETRTQTVGLLLGGAVGFALLLIDQTPGPLLTGFGVLAAIFLCCQLKLYYAISLTAIIALSVCVSTSGSPMTALAWRLLDTAIGMAVGLAVNVLVKPYNNRHRVTALLKDMAGRVPAYLDQCVLRGLYPDLSGYEKALRDVETEHEIYRRQRFRRQAGHEQDVIFLSGAIRLAARIYQELCALACMDALGVPSPENLGRLRALGLAVPARLERPCTEEDSVVTNFHLNKLLDARSFLLELLQG